jgi:hypothetical protein
MYNAAAVDVRARRGVYPDDGSHEIPPDASYENYLYYWQLVREVAEGKHRGARFGDLLTQRG